MANLLVFIERRNGEIKRPALEALGKARELAGEGRVSALVLGPGAAETCGPLGQHGADRVVVCDEPFLEHYATEAYAACLAEAARTEEADLVLVAATILGKDLAPRAAARLETGVASDLIALTLTDDGSLHGKRPVYSGKAIAGVAIRSARPAFATLRPNAFPAPSADPAHQAEQVPLDCPIAESDLRVRTVRVETPERKELDVAEASIVVSGGRGLREPDNFKLVRDLAEVLGAAVGASRAVVDDGWISHAHQVGQTGKVVSPNLYVACGISGAIQHLAGMSSSKVIVAINKDAEAPIFKAADYGIVGDLFELLPELTSAIREL